MSSDIRQVSYNKSFMVFGLPLISEKLNELTEEDWRINECKNPFGSYFMKYKQNSGRCYGVLENKEDFEELDREIKQGIPDLEYVVLSRYKDGKIQKKELFNRNKFAHKTNFAD
jgi:hypothetical protein